VRGYGLVDSPKVQAAPGKTLDLKAVVAPSAAAAEYYPPIYWYSMLRIDDPGAGWKGRALWATYSNRTVFRPAGKMNYRCFVFSMARRRFFLETPQA
jgi:hypothetical protein